MSQYKFKVGCLFSGMGGFPVGMKKARIQPLWANELDRFACKTLQRNHQDVDLFPKDIRDLSVEGDKLLPVDILTAGFPCQSFSVAGYRRGFEDDRGKLFDEIIRIIGEFGERKPKILLMENVPNLRNGDNGNWFEQIVNKIKRSGYWFDEKLSAEILDTSCVSELPQHRKRLFMVAFSKSVFDETYFQFPCSRSPALGLKGFINRRKKADKSDYLSPENKYYQLISKEIRDKRPDEIYHLRRSYVRSYRNKCPTLTANMGAGGHNVPFIKDRWGIRRLTVEECCALQGFDGYRFPEDVPIRERYRQIGNAVSVPVATILARECAKILEGVNKSKSVA